MTAKLLPALLLLVPSLLCAQEGETTRYYSSNPLGMPLQEIGRYRLEEFSYVLTVRTAAGGETRTLLYEGKELRRWEYEPGEQRAYRGSELEERRRYDGEDRLIEEQTYANGRLERRTVYYYRGEVLERTETFAADGRLLFRDHYRLSADGRLRRVTRQYSGDETEQQLALAEGSRGVAEERYGSSRERRINRYDPAGRLVEREYWYDGQLIEREGFEYRGEGEALLSSRLEEPALERVTVRSHDEEGRVVEIEVREGEKRTERTVHVRDSLGRIVETTRRGPKGVENWRFEYGPEDSLEREEYRVRGSLERVTRYFGQGEERVDELYREDSLFMRVHYRSGQKVREEFLRDGEVVRVRDLQ